MRMGFQDGISDFGGTQVKANTSAFDVNPSAML